MRFALVTSFPLDVRIGSGVVRSLEGFRAGLQTIGHQAEIIHPQAYQYSSYQDLALKRLKFNRKIEFQDFSKFDVVLGSDFDGHRIQIPVHCRYLAFNAGILADILQFEKGKIKSTLKHLAKRECQNVNKAEIVLVPSQFTRQKVHDLYGVSLKKIKVVPLAVSNTFLQALRQTEMVSEPGSHQILCVARQYQRKGISDLIKAFHLVQQQIKSLTLKIIGAGPCEKSNRQLAKKLGQDNNIVFAGDVDDIQLLAENYKKSALFCLPSYHETFGIAFVEAMSTGLPVVAYKSTAVTEVVGSGSAILCKPGDVKALAEAMFLLLRDTKLAKVLGLKGKQQAGGLSWTKSAETLIKLL